VQEIIGHFEGKLADLVVCDGAPDGNTQPPLRRRRSLSLLHVAHQLMAH
jgi:hypothetical protein